jgi:TolB-like protein
VRVYRVTGTPRVAVPTPKIATAKPSIAVLPFTNMSGDPEHEYFADGITEDIITDLSKVSGLSVIARHGKVLSGWNGRSLRIRTSPFLPASAPEPWRSLANGHARSNGRPVR